MSIDEKKKREIEWYDNPDVITNFIIGLIALIIILSQSFAINNNLSAVAILSSILNHNISYLLVCVYFVALKTKIGKQYFDFLNIFMIILHLLVAITSVLTVFQSFGLGSLLGMAIDLLILIYLVHTFLRSTSVWKSVSLNKSPFNEISNSGYFNSILVLAITLLAVNLISTTSFDGTILSLMDTAYTILFIRYIFLYGEFLNIKKISIKNEGNFDEYREKITDTVNNFVEEHKLDDKFDNVKNKVVEFTEDVKGKAVDIKEDIENKIKEAELDKKIDDVKEKVIDFADDVKEKALDVKEEISDKIKESNIDDAISDLVEDVKVKVKDVKKDIEEKVESSKKEKKVSKTKTSSKKKANESKKVGE